MRNKSMTLIAMLTVLIVVGVTPVMAGDGSAANKVSTLLANKHETDNFKLIHVADLAALKADPKSHVVILDANAESTRDKYGVIPERGCFLRTTNTIFRRNCRPRKIPSWFSTVPTRVAWRPTVPRAERSGLAIRT